MNDKTWFLLGADDQEMREIAAVLKSIRYRYRFAHITRVGTPSSERVDGHSAFNATHVCSDEYWSHACLVQDWFASVWVECGIVSSISIPAPYEKIDHHHPGDHGYGVEPANYWQASSLGQVCSGFGIKPNAQQLMAAAADHCLKDAYAGNCPKIEPSWFGEYRLGIMAAEQKVSIATVLTELQRAKDMLNRAPREGARIDLRKQRVDYAVREMVAMLDLQTIE